MLYALLYTLRASLRSALYRLSTPDMMQRDEVTQQIITSAQHCNITSARHSTRHNTSAHLPAISETCTGIWS